MDTFVHLFAVFFLLIFTATVACILFTPSSEEREDSAAADTNNEFADIQHRKKHYLCTPAERKFHASLKRVLGDTYDVHCQVSLIALTEPVKFAEKKRAWSKRVDFVITDKDTRIVAVIELDDSSHGRSTRARRDKYVEHSLRGHHPLLRFQSNFDYQPVDIASRLSGVMERIFPGSEVSRQTGVANSASMEELPRVSSGN